MLNYLMGGGNNSDLKMTVKLSRYLPERTKKSVEKTQNI
jgi:hypothetical protein